MSLAAKNNLDLARAEQSEFLAAVNAVPREAISGKNAAHDVLGIAEKMLAGELLYREGKSAETGKSDAADSDPSAADPSDQAEAASADQPAQNQKNDDRKRV